MRARVAITLLVGLASAASLPAQQPVHFATDDGAKISADLYAGSGRHAVVLAHGGRHTKENWRPQAEILARAGYPVLAIDFRGYGASTGPGMDDPLSAPLHLDVLGAARHLREQGAKTVTVIGGSLGGMAAGDAAIQAGPGVIDRIVFLGANASLAGLPLERMSGRKLFIVARQDARADGSPRLVRIQEDMARVPPPRELYVLEGSAHAQALFETNQSAALLDRLLRFLAEP